mgnify:CR=1 FL=1
MKKISINKSLVKFHFNGKNWFTLWISPRLIPGRKYYYKIVTISWDSYSGGFKIKHN